MRSPLLTAVLPTYTAPGLRSMPRIITWCRTPGESNRANLGITHRYQFKCAIVSLFI